MHHHAAVQVAVCCNDFSVEINSQVVGGAKFVSISPITVDHDHQSIVIHLTCLIAGIYQIECFLPRPVSPEYDFESQVKMESLLVVSMSEPSQTR